MRIARVRTGYRKPIHLITSLEQEVINICVRCADYILSKPNMFRSYKTIMRESVISERNITIHIYRNTSISSIKNEIKTAELHLSDTYKCVRHSNKQHSTTHHDQQN
jgi:hypothetical protein